MITPQSTPINNYIALVSAGDEHNYTSPHDVEPRTLLLHQPRTPLRERLRRRRRHAVAPPLSPPSRLLQQGGAILCAATSALLHGMLPLLIHACMYACSFLFTHRST